MNEGEIAKVVWEVLRNLRVGTSNVPQEYYSIKDAAALVSVSADHIRRAVIGKELVASDIGTARHPVYRISRENILRWMKRNQRGALPPRKGEDFPEPISRHHLPKKRNLDRETP